MHRSRHDILFRSLSLSFSLSLFRSLSLSLSLSVCVCVCVFRGLLNTTRESKRASDGREEKGARDSTRYQKPRATLSRSKKRSLLSLCFSLSLFFSVNFFGLIFLREHRQDRDRQTDRQTDRGKNFEEKTTALKALRKRAFKRERIFVRENSLCALCVCPLQREKERERERERKKKRRRRTTTTSEKRSFVVLPRFLLLDAFEYLLKREEEEEKQSLVVREIHQERERSAKRTTRGRGEECD